MSKQILGQTLTFGTSVRNGELAIEEIQKKPTKGTFTAWGKGWTVLGTSMSFGKPSARNLVINRLEYPSPGHRKSRKYVVVKQYVKDDNGEIIAATVSTEKIGYKPKEDEEIGPCYEPIPRKKKKKK